MSNTVAGFQHDGAKAALQNMRSRSETNGTCSDDGDGFCSTHLFLLYF
jgi:hypothetical protein